MQYKYQQQARPDWRAQDFCLWFRNAERGQCCNNIDYLEVQERMNVWVLFLCSVRLSGKHTGFSEMNWHTQKTDTHNRIKTALRISFKEIDSYSSSSLPGNNSFTMLNKHPFDEFTHCTHSYKLDTGFEGSVTEVQLKGTHVSLKDQHYQCQLALAS